MIYCVLQSSELNRFWRWEYLHAFDLNCIHNIKWLYNNIYKHCGCYNFNSIYSACIAIIHLVFFKNIHKNDKCRNSVYNGIGASKLVIWQAFREAFALCQFLTNHIEMEAPVTVFNYEWIVLICVIALRNCSHFYVATAGWRALITWRFLLIIDVILI